MVRRQQAAVRAIRPKLGRPGHLRFHWGVVAALWAGIAKGSLPGEASAVAGVARAVGARWFRRAGGMLPFDINYLSLAEREEIAVGRAWGKGGARDRAGGWPWPGGDFSWAAPRCGDPWRQGRVSGAVCCV